MTSKMLVVIIGQIGGSQIRELVEIAI